MSDYEVKQPRKKAKKEVFRIPSQTKELSEDIYNADKEGVSYGKYMALKYEREDLDFIKKFGVKRRYSA